MEVDAWRFKKKESRKRRPGMSGGLGREEIFGDLGGNRFGRTVGAWRGVEAEG